MRKYTAKVSAVCLLLLMTIFWTFTIAYNVRPVKAATLIGSEQILEITAVDATILDGTTTDRTYMATDRLIKYSVILSEGADAVEIYVYSTGDDTAGDTAKINVYGYSKLGPALRIYEAATFTLGTAVAPGSGLYADTVSGTDKHTTEVNVADSGDNAIVKIMIDTVGLKYLYFEPETFTGISNVFIVVRQYGFKR